MKSAPSDRARLIGMGVLLILVTGLFFWLRNETPTPEPIEDPFRPALEENAPPAASVDQELLAQVQDGSDAQRVARESRPFLHLLMESGKLVPGDFRRMDTLALDSDRFEEVLADPASFRGRPVTARGFFSFARERTVSLALDDSGGGQKLPYFEGLVQDDLGRQYSFSILERPDGFQPGEVVKVPGFFFKRFRMQAPDDPDRWIEPTLHIVGKKLVRSFYRMEPVTELSSSLLDTVRDYEISDQLEIPEEALYHVLSYVQNTDADELARQAGDRTAHELRKNPAEFRGERVRLLGTFHDSWPRHLGPEGENPLDLPVVWHGLLIHGGPTFTYLIGPEREPEWVRSNVNVIAEGVFLKRYAYQAKNGEIVPCPLIIVKRFVSYNVDTASVNNAFSMLLIGLAVLLLGWFGISVYTDRRSTAEYRRRFLERRRARQQTATESGDAP